MDISCTDELLLDAAVGDVSCFSAGKPPLRELVDILTQSRVALLARLKKAGVERLGERQAICNALSKAIREGRVVLDGGTNVSPRSSHASATPNAISFKEYDDAFTLTACLQPLDEATSRARATLKTMTAARRAMPVQASVVVIGAGVAGLHAAIELLQQNPSEDVVVLEKARSVGGVWRDHANSYSRVNSSEPSYRMFGGAAKTNHTPAHQILESMADAMKAHGLIDKVFTSCDVQSVRRRTDGEMGWVVSGAEEGGEEFRIASEFVMLCTNRRLGKPRELALRGEEEFAGCVQRGLADDASPQKWGRTLIVGMGAFALEHFRTALERGAAHATVLCRRRGTVCPQVIDWVNYVRPVRDDFSKFAAGNTVVQVAWLKTYQLSTAKVPECWNDRPRLLKPDGHTVSTSDLFFVAHHMRMAATLLGEVSHVVREGVVTQDHGEAPSSTLPCEVIVKCVGFHLNTTNEEILGASSFRGIGMVDDNLWYVAETHIDASTFSLPFGSSFLNQAQFLVKVAGRARNSASFSAPLRQLPCDASVRHFSSLNVFNSILAAQSANNEITRMLHEHVAETSARFERALPFREYLDRNEIMWAEYHRMLSEMQRAANGKHLPWLFRGFEAMVDAEQRDASSKHSRS
jgi:hypothetical protein